MSSLFCIIPIFLHLFAVSASITGLVISTQQNENDYKTPATFIIAFTGYSLLLNIFGIFYNATLYQVCVSISSMASFTVALVFTLSLFIDITDIPDWITWVQVGISASMLISFLFNLILVNKSLYGCIRVYSNYKLLIAVSILMHLFSSASSIVQVYNNTTDIKSNVTLGVTLVSLVLTVAELWFKATAFVYHTILSCLSFTSFASALAVTLYDLYWNFYNYITWLMLAGTICLFCAFIVNFTILRKSINSCDEKEGAEVSYTSSQYSEYDTKMYTLDPKYYFAVD